MVIAAHNHGYSVILPVSGVYTCRDQESKIFRLETVSLADEANGLTTRLDVFWP